jgi:hypothetical protein
VSGRLALLLAVAAAGCQDREVVGAITVKSVLVMAARGGSITVTADEDPVLAGVLLQIPPGSLPRDLTVTIERGGQDLTRTTSLTPFGPVVIVGPRGTRLSSPALLAVPVRPETTSDRLFIYAPDTDGGRATLASTRRPNAASALADIDRFDAFQAVFVPLPALPPPPPAGR